MIKRDKLLYSGHTRTIGGREGLGSSVDGRLHVQLSPPGAPGDGTNPEQLLGVGWSACFLSSLRHACNARKVEFPADTRVDAQVELRHGERGFFLEVGLRVVLPGLDPALAQGLIEAAHQSCPFSKAMRGNIDVTLTCAPA